MGFSDGALAAFITGAFGVLAMALQKLRKESKNDACYMADALERIEDKIDKQAAKGV